MAKSVHARYEANFVSPRWTMMLKATNDTSKELAKKTVKELKDLLTKDLTKRDLLVAIVGSENIPDEIIRTYRKDNQIEYQEEVLRDGETDEVSEIKQMLWTYYKTGEVDEITTVILKDGKETRRVIKHYRDGRQPEVL